MLDLLSHVLKEGEFVLTTSGYACLLGIVQSFSLQRNLAIFLS